MANVSHIKLPNGTVLDLAGGGGGGSNKYVIFGDLVHASTTFTVGDIVSYNGSYYQCSHDTSNAFFDENAWTELTVTPASVTACTANNYYSYNNYLYLCTNSAYFDPNDTTNFTRYSVTNATPATSCNAGTAYYLSASQTTNYICTSAATFDPNDTTHFTQVTATSLTSGTACTANKYYYKSGDNNHIYKCITAAGFDTSDTTHFEAHETITVSNGGSVTAGNWYYCASASSYIYYCNTSGTFNTSSYSSTCTRYSRTSGTEGTACTTGNYYYQSSYLYYCTADTKFCVSYYTSYFTRQTRTSASTGTSCSVNSYYKYSNNYYKCLVAGPFKPTDSSSFQQITPTTATVTTGTLNNLYSYSSKLYQCNTAGAVFSPNSAYYTEVTATTFVLDTSGESATLTINPSSYFSAWNISAQSIVDAYTANPTAEFIFIFYVNSSPIICRESKSENGVKVYYTPFNLLTQNRANDAIYQISGYLSFSINCSTGACTNTGTSSITYVSDYSAEQVNIGGGGGGGEIDTVSVSFSSAPSAYAQGTVTAGTPAVGSLLEISYNGTSSKGLIDSTDGVNYYANLASLSDLTTPIRIGIDFTNSPYVIVSTLKTISTW